MTRTENWKCRTMRKQRDVDRQPENCLDESFSFRLMSHCVLRTRLQTMKSLISSCRNRFIFLFSFTCCVLSMQLRHSSLSPLRMCQIVSTDTTTWTWKDKIKIVNNGERNSKYYGQIKVFFPRFFFYLRIPLASLESVQFCWFNSIDKKYGRNVFGHDKNFITIYLFYWTK